MQAGQHSQADRARAQPVRRQAEGNEGKAERVERHHPVQADHLLGRQQGEEQQWHHHQATQQPLRPERGAELGPVLPAQPCRHRRDQVDHHRQIGRRLLPGEHLAGVAVDQVEHDVRPAVLDVPRDVDRRAGQRAQQQHRESREALTTEQRKVHEVGEPEHHREILRQEGRAEQQARQRIESPGPPIEARPTLGDQQTAGRRDRPEDQRRVGGDQHIEPVDRRQPEQQHRPRGPCAIDRGQRPPQQAADRGRQQQHRQPDRPQRVAERCPHRADQPADHWRVVVVAPVAVDAPPVEVGLVTGDRQGH